MVSLGVCGSRDGPQLLRQRLRGGARYAWSGNRKAGSGTMEIVASTAPNSIKIRLEFTKPFKAVNPTTFTLI